MANDIVLYQERAVDDRNRLAKKSVDIEPITAKKNYYDTADIKYFTSGDIKKLIDGASNSFNKMLFVLLYETGARVSEARNIRFNDIDPATLKIRVITLKQRNKSRIYRVLKISDKLMSLILQRRLKYNFADTDFILSKKPTKRQVTPQGINFIIKKEVSILLNKSGMDKAHPHTFRHSRAIHLLDAGMNIMLLKNFLGHSNISNTLIYLKYSNKDLCDAIDKANNKEVL